MCELVKLGSLCGGREKQEVKGHRSLAAREEEDEEEDDASALFFLMPLS